MGTLAAGMMDAGNAMRTQTKNLLRVKGIPRQAALGDKLQETKAAPEVDEVGVNISPLANIQRLRYKRAERRVADVSL